MNLQTIKENILESPLGYKLWSGSVNGPKHEAVRRMIARTANPRGRALDIGCGPGTSADLFADDGYLGVDHNPQYIAEAAKKFPRKRFAVGDAAKLAVGSEKFDIVLINSLMHHLDDDSCRSLLQSIWPVLAEGSSVIIQEPLTARGGEPLIKFFMNQDRGDFFRPLPAWQDLFRSSGYQVSAEEFYDLKLANLVVGWHMYVAILRR